MLEDTGQAVALLHDVLEDEVENFAVVLAVESAFVKPQRQHAISCDGSEHVEGGRVLVGFNKGDVFAVARIEKQP